MDDNTLRHNDSGLTICHECDVLMRLPSGAVSSTFRCPLWLVSPKVSLSEVSRFETIVGGTYIDMKPNLDGL